MVVVVVGVVGHASFVVVVDVGGVGAVGVGDCVVVVVVVVEFVSVVVVGNSLVVGSNKQDEHSEDLGTEIDRLEWCMDGTDYDMVGLSSIVVDIGTVGSNDEVLVWIQYVVLSLLVSLHSYHAC